MQWASALSQQNSLRAALSECAASIRANMGDTAADLAVVFASSEYASDYANLPELMGELLGHQALVLDAPVGVSSAEGARLNRSRRCQLPQPAYRG